MKNNIYINCHSSIKVVGNKTIYFDPYCIEEETHDADIIFVTHDHYDHYDLPSIQKLMKEDTLIVIPSSCLSNVTNSDIKKESFFGVSPNSEYTIKDIKVSTVPSYNSNKEFHKKEYNWVGYIVEMKQEKIYVAGDTDNIEELHSINCDIALIPIGGTYTMTPVEAADLINTIKPNIVIPTHYAKIVGTKEDANIFKDNLNPEIECITLIK